VPSGRARGGGRRWRDWLGRVLAPEHRDPEDAEAPDSGAAAPSPGVGGAIDTQASLDQVLRNAAEARGASRDGDD
jgi:hypothetical protein